MSLALTFTPTSSLANGLHIRAALGSGPTHLFQVDTGSVGMLVPRNILGPEFQQPGSSQGTTFGFVSDGNSYTGHWLQGPVVFGVPEAWDGSGDFATALVEVFAVDTPESFVGGMLGIGFGIEKQANGGPPSNPFLHLTYKGENLPPSYIIREDGIDVGLTQIESDGFTLVPLIGDADDSDWLQPIGSLGLDNASPVDLPFLMDTGIPEMLLFLPPQTPPIPRSTLSNGTTVSISLSAPDGVQSLAYQFVTGESGNPMAPASVELRNGHGINTGINVLAGADYLFDAEGGQIGFRAR